MSAQNNITYQLIVDGQVVAPGSTAPAGGDLVVEVAGWQAVWIDRNYKGDTGKSIWNKDGRFDYGPLPEGDQFFRVGNSDVQGKMGFWFYLTGVKTLPPTPVPSPAPAPTLPVTRTSGIEVTADFDGGGGRIEHFNPSTWSAVLTPKRAGVAIRNAMLFTPPGKNYGINVSVEDVLVEGVSFPDGNGYPIIVRGDGATIRNCLAGTFADYFVFVEGAKDVVIEGCRVFGGSTRESIVRMDEAANFTIRDCTFDYTAWPRKAVVRGSGTGRIERCTFRGAIVGVNPLTGGDGGQLHGIAKFVTDRIVTAGDGLPADQQSAKIAACIAAVRAAVDAGEKDQRKLCRIGAQVASITLTDAQVTATVERRRVDLAKRSDVVFKDVEIDFGIRWEANTRYVFEGGAVIGSNETGSPFVNPGSVYPEPRCLLPGDVPMSPPDITFRRTRFVSARLTPAQFAAQAAALGVRLEDCTFNGEPL